MIAPALQSTGIPSWESQLTEMWPSVLGIGVILLAVLAVLVRLARTRRAVSAPRSSGAWVPLADVDGPTCICGDPATHPAPHLAVGRGVFDRLRTVYGLPPRYRRAVDSMRRPTLCFQHARVADALFENWILGTRQKFGLLSASTAAEAAAFETEGLENALRETFAAAQKKALQRRSSASTTVSRIGRAEGDS